MAAFEVVALDTATPQLRAPGTGDTYSMPRAVALAPETLTGSAATSALSITQTWNTTGTPTGLDFTVTDTASNAASRLFRFTSGGIERLVLTKTGVLHGAGASSGAFILGSKTQFRPGSIAIGAQIGAFSTGSATGGGFLCSDDSGTLPIGGWSNRGIALTAAAVFGWTSSVAAAAVDLELHRGAADVLELRRSTNAQELRVSGTWSDASNHRRVVLKMSSAGVAELKAEGAGTGASGNVLHISSLPTSNPGPGILWNNAGTPAIGT